MRMSLPDPEEIEFMAKYGDATPEERAIIDHIRAEEDAGADLSMEEWVVGALRLAAGARGEGALRTLIEDYVLAQRERSLPHRSPEIAAEALTNATKAFRALCEVADAGGRIEDRRAALSASPADPPDNESEA